MDTPTRTPLLSSHRLRIAFFVGLILLVQSAFAFLLSWIDPPRMPLFVPIQTALPNQPAKMDQTLFTNAKSVEPHRQGILQALDDLTLCGERQPVIVYLSAAAVQADAGSVFILPADASLDDAAGWLPLRVVLEKLKACPSKQKLLVLELTPPPGGARSGFVYHDCAAALPHELEAVPDADRLVLSACAAGQRTHFADELGQSVFAHYFREGLHGSADGYDGLRDGHIGVKELAAFVAVRVERWAGHNRGERQTPTLQGTGADFTLASIDRAAPRQMSPALPERQYPEGLTAAWRQRDAAFQAGNFRWTPREFQQAQARLLRAEENADARFAPFTVQADADQHADPLTNAAKKTFEEDWRSLEQQLAAAPAADSERIKKRFVEETRGKTAPGQLAAAVFAHALADPRLDAGTVRLCDQLLHPAPQSPPRSAEALRVRLLADLAMRVEIQAWPREVVEALLRATDQGERAFRQTPYLPNYVTLLEEPALLRHAGEMRLWTRGYSSLEEAKKNLTEAAAQFERLIHANEQWRRAERTLDEALADLPWYLEALEALPEQREVWLQATATAAGMAERLQEPRNEEGWWLRLEKLHSQATAASAAAVPLQSLANTLHAPFTRDAIASLERQCRAPQADGQLRQRAEAILRVGGPILKAEDRALLWRAVRKLSRRLNGETLALDRQDDESGRRTVAEVKTPLAEDETQRAAWRAKSQLALLELAGVSAERLRPLKNGLERCEKNAADPVGWCELGVIIRHLTHRQMAEQYVQETTWRERERLAWVMPPLDSFKKVDAAKVSPTLEQRRRDKERLAHWRVDFQRYLACDYQGLGFNSPGILAARDFYAHAVGKEGREPRVRMNVAVTVEPLTPKHAAAPILLEVTRQVPPGAFGPVELQMQRTDDVWLDVAPLAATLPALTASKEPRMVTHKVPLAATRKPKAERTGLPAPLGFLVEARFEGRLYHYLVTVPIVPSTQELQILVSADPDEPNATLNEIRVRPGKVKQPHYVYVKNLTNRPQRVHVDVKAGDAFVYKSPKLLTIEPDGVRKVLFDETQHAAELRGPVQIHVLDAERQKVLDEKSLRVEVLSPQEYVKAAEARYEPGGVGQNRWAVQIEAAKLVHGPAITAQLVLLVQRIPGLMGIGGGTLRVDLPTQANAPRILFAENLRLIHAADSEGPVYLNIDGVPRAFVYRTTFSRAGEPTLTRPDDTPAVRIVAPPCVTAGINCLVDVEVDNAPPGCRLEIALGRSFNDGSFKAELVRDFADAKRRRIDLETSKDALVFDAMMSDWTATFDTRSIVGARELRARLINAAGQQIAMAKQTVIIDDSPPIAKIAPSTLPAQAKRGSVLQVQADGADPESGIAQVIFFFGRPDRGEVPPLAPRFKAIPLTRDQTKWQAPLPIPADHRGPLPISVQVVNHAGLASIDTITIDITDNEPGKTGLGEIRGTVVEGPRPQPNLIVTLLDDAGKELARTRTDANGNYAFPQLPPGRYRVICVKPESQRRAILNVIVEPDRGAKGDLALVL